MRALRRAVLFFGLAACAVAAAPTVASVSPNSGPSTGGTPISITGTGFTGATDVTIGGNSLGTGGYLVVNATTITLSTPSGTVGPASVVVITPGGSSPANTLFTYLPAPPSVGGITPNTGSTEGGTKLTIVGSGFTGATAVTIGGVPATGISAKNDTQITVTTGPGTAGNSSVAVTTPNGTSYPNKLFTYITPGTILYTQILGQPTDHNATINIQANAALDISYRYGRGPGVYSGTTGIVSAAADPYTAGAYVAQAVLSGLQPDTAYYYQIQYRLTGSGATFTAGAERVFHTQRLPGSTFVFTVQGDSHPERVLKMFHSDLYNKTLSAAAAENPDFHITSGDDFSVDTIALPYTQPAVSARYTLQLPYFNLLNTSALFLGTGNHEETSLFNYNLPADPTNNSNQVATWAQNARNLYYASPGPSDPITGTFYTGNQTQLPNINGYLRDYYAWTWGDALFVVIDPYWGSPSMVDTPLGANSSGTSKNSDGWSKSHGNAQYQWLAQTLQSSKAKWKFIFAHHVMGTGRGGVEVAPLYEWGGSNANGTPGFAANRQPFNDGTLNYSWPEPIHKLLVDNNVTIFFGAHDHIYVHQQLDGVHYQALPNPGDNTYTAFNADAYTQPGQSLYPDAGYVKVTVASTGVKVDYVREFLPQDETATLKSGMIQDSYTIGAVVTPPPTCTYALNLSGAGYASTGGAGTIAVTTGAGCAWSVTGVPLWVTLLSGASGTGSGTVSYQVTSNTGGTRTAAMTVAGVAFNVEQTAAAGVISGLVPVGSLAQVNSQGGWGFELDAVNVGTAPAIARVNFTDPSGNALPLPLTFPQTSSSGIELASTFDRTINPNARVVITSTGSTTAPTLLGSGQLLSNGSVSGFGIFSYPQSQWNAVVPLETRSASAYYLPFDNTGVLHTGVALSNITASAVNVNVTVLNDAGTQIRTDSINLPAQGYQQFLLDTQYAQTAGLRGSVQFTTASAGQISVLGVRANGAALTTLPVLSNVGPAGGSISDVTYNGGFTSTFYLVNTGSSAASFTLRFFDQNGNPANVPLLLPQTGVTQTTTALTQTLAAGQMLEVATQANDAAANISGSAQLTSTGNVSGFEIFRWNTYAQEASVPLETRTPGSFLLVFDNTSPLNTGVSLTNAIASPAIIPTTIYDDQGNVLQTATVALPGRGQQVFMLSANYPITAGKRGMVQFTVPSTGPISMIGIRTSGTTLTTVPILTGTSSGPVITGTPPGAPINVSATGGNTTASILFTAPASNGGTAITNYIATCTGGGATFTGVGIASPVLVTGFTNGTSYSCTVAAANAAGTGSPSASVSVVPTGTTASGSFALTSATGLNNGVMPAAYTCDGTGSTLPLAWSGAPAGTAEYAILLSTIPAPGQLKYDWVLYHIPGTTTSLAQDSFLVGTVGVGDDGPGATYDPPCSSGPGAKLYTITIYALSSAPTFSVPANQVTGDMVATAIAPLTLGTAQLNLSYTRYPTATGSNAQSPGYNNNCLYIRFSLQAAKDGTTSIGCDGTYAYVSSIGLPIGNVSDTMMTGITSTNLQVPTPTDFLGAHGWKIPMNAVYTPNSATPVPSGPIGVAINGVPIFNPCVQNGCNATTGDTKALGQLDVCNGHAGRADDYHYHAAPNCLMTEQPNSNYWNTHPIGWLLDGFALFGYQNADGSAPVKDSCGIAPVSGQPATLGGSTYPYNYAYHVQDTFPYTTNNCVSGVPSPDLPNQGSKYNPMRQPPVTPFNNTNMTLTTDPADGYQVLQFSSPNPFTTTDNGQNSFPNPPGTYKIRYTQLFGAALQAQLVLNKNAGATACWNFQFTDVGGNTTEPSVVYCKKNPQ